MNSEALKFLVKDDWPGNIRELQNVCERLQILSEGHEDFMVNDLPDNIRDPQAEADLVDYDPQMTLHDLEKNIS